MADITDKLLTDLSKVRSTAKTSKSRAKAENKQQAKVILNFAKAMGNATMTAFTKKLRSIEKSMQGAKSFNQRVTIKTSYSIESNPVKAKKLLKAHVDYITRSNTGGTQPFNANVLNLEKEQLKAFIEGSPKENEKTFRFIISPENAKNFESDESFKLYIRDCMKKLSDDLPGKPELIWTADIHYDTDNPHCHVLMKGMSKEGNDIQIPKEYIKTQFRENAEKIATYYLGTRSIEDIKEAKRSEITAKRFTSLDYEILNNAVFDVFNTKSYDNSVKSQQSRLTNYIVPRLDYLVKIGLATKEKTKYTLLPDFKKTLQEMPLNNDIIKKLAMIKKTHFVDGITKYDPYENNSVIKGTVVDKGFYNEEKQLIYVIVLDENKKSHFVKLQKNSETEGNETHIGATVELTTKSFTSKNGQEIKFPQFNVISLMSQQDQVTFDGITDLDKRIALNDYIHDNPNIYQQQTQIAVDARIQKLMSEKKLFNIEGRYRFAKTYWLESEKSEHSQLDKVYKNITYTRLAEKETFNGRMIATKQFGNETHAIISNGREYIVIPMRGRMNKYNDKNTTLEITMTHERKGFSSPKFMVKPILQAAQDQTHKI